MSVKILKIRHWMVDQTTLLLYIWLESRSQLSKITKKWYLYPIFIVKNISFGTSKTLSNFCYIKIWSRVIWNTDVGIPIQVNVPYKWSPEKPFILLPTKPCAEK